MIEATIYKMNKERLFKTKFSHDEDFNWFDSHGFYNFKIKNRKIQNYNYFWTRFFSIRKIKFVFYLFLKSKYERKLSNLIVMIKDYKTIIFFFIVLISNIIKSYICDSYLFRMNIYSYRYLFVIYIYIIKKESRKNQKNQNRNSTLRII